MLKKERGKEGEKEGDRQREGRKRVKGREGEGSGFLKKGLKEF